MMPNLNPPANQYIDYNKFFSKAEELADQIKIYSGRKIIMPLLRGGQTLGWFLHTLIPCSVYAPIDISYRGKSRQVKDRLQSVNLPIDILNQATDRKSLCSAANGEYSLVIVDDIADSGKTLIAVDAILRATKEFKTQTPLYVTWAYKNCSLFKPDITGEEFHPDTWVHFPWEKGENLDVDGPEVERSSPSAVTS